MRRAAIYLSVVVCCLLVAGPPTWRAVNVPTQSFESPEITGTGTSR